LIKHWYRYMHKDVLTAELKISLHILCSVLALKLFLILT
jgi:hypothetical protein